jgi:hypothetical protein
VVDEGERPEDEYVPVERKTSKHRHDDLGEVKTLARKNKTERDTHADENCRPIEIRQGDYELRSLRGIPGGARDSANQNANHRCGHDTAPDGLAKEALPDHEGDHTPHATRYRRNPVIRRQGRSNGGAESRLGR